MTQMIPREENRIEELEHQLKMLLDIVEKSGRMMSEVDEIFNRWFVPRRDMKEMISKHGELGKAMVRACEQTRAKVFP